MAGNVTQQRKCTLYVGGLDDTVNEKLLQAAFISFGDIVDVQIPMDFQTQKHRGFGFVQFELPEDAAAAIDNMDQAELLGKTLRVNYARPIKPTWQSAKPVQFSMNVAPKSPP